MSDEQQSEMFPADVVKGRIVATSHQARGVENTERSGEVRIHFNTDLHQSFLTCQALTARAVAVINKYNAQLSVQCEPFLSAQTSDADSTGNTYSLHVALENFPAPLDGREIVRAIVVGFNGHPEPIKLAKAKWTSLSDIEFEIYEGVFDSCLSLACNWNTKCFPVALDLFYGETACTDEYIGTIEIRHSRVKREDALPELESAANDQLNRDKAAQNTPQILVCTSPIVRWEKNVGRPTIYLDHEKVDILLDDSLLTEKTLHEWSNEVTPETRNHVYKFYLEKTGDRDTQFKAYRVEYAPALAMTSYWVDDERHVETASAQASDCNESEANAPEEA